MDSKKKICFSDIRKGIRNIIFEYLDYEDLSNLKTTILNSELTKHYSTKLILSKLCISKLDISLISLKKIKHLSHYCCLSLFPEHPDSILYTQKNRLIIEDLANNNIREIEVNAIGASIRMVHFKKLKFWNEDIGFLFVIDELSTLQVIYANDFKTLYTYQLNNYWHFEVFQAATKVDNLDIIVSGLRGLTKYSGNLESNKLVLVRAFDFPSGCIFYFSIINELIFCGSDRMELIVLDYKDLSIVSIIEHNNIFRKKIRTCEKLSFQENTIALGTEDIYKSIVIIDFALSQKNEFKWKVLNTIPVGAIFSLKYLRFKLRNYLIAGSGMVSSTLFIIDLKEYQIIYTYSWKAMWINYITVTYEDILIATGHYGIQFFSLK